MKNYNEEVSEVLKKFSDWILYEKGYSQNTKEAYFYDLGMFFSFFAKKHNINQITLKIIKELSLSDIRECLFWRSTEACKNSNKRFLSSIKSFARFLLRQGIEINQSIFSIQQAKSDKVLPRPLTQDEIAQITDQKESATWEEKRNRAIFITLYATGMRISELISLNVQDFFNIKNDGYTKITGKGNKERIIPFLAQSIATIEDYVKSTVTSTQIMPNTPLFINKNCKRITPADIQKKMREMRQNYNLHDKSTPHSLRHSFASHMIENGAELRYVQELLGHSSAKSTQVYTQINMKALLKEHKATHPRNNISQIKLAK